MTITPYPIDIRTRMKWMMKMNEKKMRKSGWKIDNLVVRKLEQGQVEVNRRRVLAREVVRVDRSSDGQSG